MKVSKLIGFGIATVAAAGIALASTSAIANTTHHSSNNVKCYGVKGKDANSVTMVSSKKVCEQKGGTTVKPTTPGSTSTNQSNAASPKVSSAAPAAANAAAAQQVTAQTTAGNQNQ